MAWSALFLCSLLLQSGALAGPGPVSAADPQSCGVVPLDVEIIIDRSGSMGTQSPTRMSFAKTAATQLVTNLNNNGGVGTRHLVGLSSYGGDVGNANAATVNVALGSSANAATVNAGINALGTSGNTPFKLGMAAGASDLLAGDRTTYLGLTVKQVIIFLSDGRPWPDSSATRPNATEINNFKAAADEVFSIGIGAAGGTGANAIDLTLMQALAKPNDAAHFYHVVDAAGLPNIFSQIFQEIACAETPSLTTQVSGGSVVVGNSVTDSAQLSGGQGVPAGTVDFFLCGPTGAAANCTTGGSNAGAGKAVNGNGAATSNAMSPAAAGWYCFRAEYHPAQGANYLPTSHTNSSTECFQVTKVQPAVTTSANETIVAGGQIHDSASLTGGFNPTGTLTFSAYGPNNATCAGQPAFTTSVNVNGNGAYGPVAFSAPAVGTYRWIASYGGDAANSPASGACNDTGETDSITKASPSISTSLSGGGQSGTSITVALGTTVNDSSLLSGATANAGGTVTYTVFSEVACQNVVFAAGTKTVTNGIVPNSNGFAVNVAGTYYWQADYSGDANNNAASSPCNLEIVSAARNVPGLTTSANESIVVGNAIHDSASLTGGFNPSGSITFSAWGPANDTCEGQPVYTTSVNVSGNGGYGPVQFVPAAPGTYHWVASYGGDANNAAVSGGCGDPGENDTVNKAGPSISTQASAAVVVGGQISDTATVSGGSNPTGTVTFNLYGPNDAACAVSIYSDSASLVAGVATADPFTPSAAGTYRWVAAYLGDANNSAATGACNDSNESVVVQKDSPAISTTASGSVVVGGLISDVAHLSGGFNPSGTITFRLYGPGDAECESAIFTDNVSVDGNGNYTSAGFATAAAGTYRWVASYGGDVNNNAVSGACNDEDESVVVDLAQPEIATSATEGGIQGDPLSDTATVSGGFNPTGTVTFWLFASSDPSCDGQPIFTSTVALGQDGTATSESFAAPGAGAFHWIAAYSGDANNESVSGSCGDAGETSTIRQFAPDISTVLHSGELSGATLSVGFGRSVFDTATLTGAGPTASGSVTYTVYSDSDCEGAFADAGTVSVTNGSVPASDSVVFAAAGTYYWQAHYSGDANNAPATSPCQDEVLTVTAPIIHAVKLVATNDGAFGPASAAEPGDTLTFQISVSNSGDGAATNVAVSDDINALLGHSDFVSCSDSCSSVGGVLSWTIPSIAPDGVKVLTFSVALDDEFPAGGTTLPNVIVVVGPGSNCPEGSRDPDCDTSTGVNQPMLTILKDVSGFSGGTASDGLPLAKVGDILTFTLTYDVSSPPAHLAIISDPIPNGLEYVAGSATTNDEFALVEYDPDMNALTWHADVVSVDGSVSFQATVLAAAPDEVQPIVNVAFIDSADTEPSDDDASVLVQEVLGVTAPPTSTFDNHEQAPSNPGFSLMLILFALAAFVLSLGYVTPVPERARRRTEGRRR